jgi:coenzyme F420-0:L-glutamate ligase/coenzyme F420-1:gamma-L-glutamate ligase
MNALAQFTAIAVPNIPIVRPGDDLAGLILAGLRSADLRLADGDVLVIAQKVVSKAEGRIVSLDGVTPSERARQVAQAVKKDARAVEVVLSDANEIIRVHEGVLIVEQRRGFICANAGVDRSNVMPEDGDRVTLLPEDPDASARRIRDRLRQATGADVAVIINDSHGRPWRIGTVGVAIGVAGLGAVDDLRGRPDLFGYRLQHTEVGTADQIASAASLLMGQADEGRPVILLRGVPFTRREGSAGELLRPKEQDLFR